MDKGEKGIFHYTDIESVHADIENCYPIEVEMSKDNKKIIRIQKDNRKLYVGSKYNVSKDIELLINSVDTLPNREMIVVAGLAGGDYIEPLLEKMDSDSTVLIVEFNAGIVEEFIKNGEYEDYKEKFKEKNVYVIFCNERNTNLIEQAFKAHSPNASGLIVYPSYKNIYNEEIEELTKSLTLYATDAFATLATLRRFGNLWARTILRTTMLYAGNSYLIKDFKNLYKNVPAVIVSAGPSLKKNIHLLKEVCDNFVIIPGNRTLEVVLDNGVEPDFWCSVDPDEYAFLHVEKILHKTAAPYIYLDTSCDKINRKLAEIEKQQNYEYFFSYYLNHLIYLFNLNDNNEANDRLKNFKETISNIKDSYTQFIKDSKSRNFQIFNTKNASLSEYIDVNGEFVRPFGGSVAHFCTSAAIFLGCNPIIFVGQDFALTDEQHHADIASHSEKNNYLSSKSASEIDLDKKNNSSNIYVEDINGEQVRTTAALQIYLHEMSKIVAFYKDIKFIDATEGGAKIDGTEIMTFREVIELYGKSVKDSIDYSKMRKLNESPNFSNYIADIVKEATRLRSLMKKGLDLNEKIYKANLFGNKNSGSMIKKLDKIDDEIKLLLKKTTVSILSSMIVEICDKITKSKDFSNSNDDTDRGMYKNFYEKQKVLYSSIKTACECILDEFEIIENDDVPFSFIYEDYETLNTDINKILMS